MANGNYSYTSGFLGDYNSIMAGFTGTAPSTTSCRVEARRTDTWNIVDSIYVHVHVFGD